MSFKYSTKQELIDAFIVFKKGIAKRKITQNKTDFNLFFSQRMTISFCQPGTLEYFEVAHECLMDDLIDNYDRVVKKLQDNGKNRTLIVWFEEVLSRIQTFPNYIERRDGLTRDSRDIRVFINNNHSAIDRDLLRDAMILLHKLSLNDRRYYQSFKGSVTHVTIVEKVTSSSIPSNVENFKLEGNDEESMCWKPSCFVM